MLKRLLLLTAIIYTIALVIVSLINLHGVPSLGSSFDDKIYHAIAYFILGALWITYFKPSNRKYITLIILCGAIVLGFVLELLQYLVNPNRTYDTFDLLANGIGAIIGTLIASRINVFKLK